MKRALCVAVLGLGLSLASAPAWALPIQAVSAHVKAPMEPAAETRHLKSPHKSHESHKAPKTSGQGSGSTEAVASAVPEPSALLLFGVGCLIARRAVSRARR